MTHLAANCRGGPGLVHRIVRTAALVLACFALGAAKPAPQSRIIAVGDLHGDFSAWLDIAARRRDCRSRGPLGRALDHARPARRRHRPRPGFAQDRPQPPAAPGRSPQGRRPGHRRPRQPRSDEPARRQSLHDAGRICRVRRQPLGRPPRKALRIDPQAARGRRSQGAAVAGPRAVAGENAARLGRAPQRLGPDRRARPLGGAQSGDRQGRRHFVRPRRDQRRICQGAAGRGQPPRRGRDGRRRRQAAVGAQRPARALVVPRPHRTRCRRRADLARPPRPPRT